MRSGRTFLVVSLMSLVMLPVFAGSSYAQQTAGTASYDQSSAREVHRHCDLARKI